MIQVGVVGSSGYVAGELIRCLVHHPNVNIDFLYSHSNSGMSVSEMHQDLLGHSNLKFSNQINPDIDVLFLCLGHGNSEKFLKNHTFSKSTKYIDLSNDFRLKENSNLEDKLFTYGLVELNKNEIENAQYIANPGCFATAIQLGLLPLAKHSQLTESVHINAITGSTGAGKSLSDTSHFSWRNNNISIYKAFRHQHLDEINESLKSLQPDASELNFLPIRGNFTRGIFASIYTECQLSQEELITLYQSFYEGNPFVFVSEKPVHLKQVVNTNNCFIQVEKIDDKVLVTSVIDNLLKGAAGQAIQNMNLMFGLEEGTGIHFKANYL
jgi:N-acetyl-gamma-glutamyl-phosphate reductase